MHVGQGLGIGTEVLKQASDTTQVLIEMMTFSQRPRYGLQDLLLLFR